MRQILSAMTSNRVAGVFTGFITTSLIQSSSATTVMVVSFVNAGLLKLRQAIGVIMGANIGTTVTAWLIAFVGFSKFSISAWALPVMALSFPLIFMKNTRSKSLGEFLMGFGMIFLGLQFLKDSVKSFHLEENMDFIAWVNDLASSGITGVLLFVLLGTLLTVIVQSSSAAMAVTLAFMGHGLPFELGAAIVLGENIGTTITANIAALIANVQAKRAARAHLIFNIFGVVWLLIVFTPFLNGVGYAAQNWLGMGDVFNAEDGNSARLGLSLFHTTFNIINTLIMIWFVDFIAKVVTRMVKSRGDDEVFTLEYIGTGMMGTPELSLLEAYKEVARFGGITAKMNKHTAKLLEETDSRARTKLLEKIKLLEEITDRVEVEIAKYLSELSKGEMSERTSDRVRGLLSITNDLERIGDIFFQISKTMETRAEEKVYFVPKQREGLKQMFDLVDNALKIMVQNLNEPADNVNLQQAEAAEKAIDDLRFDLRNKHLKDVEKGKYSIRSGMYYSETFSSLEKVGDHIMSVSEAVVGRI